MATVRRLALVHQAAEALPPSQSVGWG